MNIDEKIRAAVLPVVPICEPDFYDGDAQTYCTFNMSEIPTAFGDDRPRHIRYLIQLHLYAPGGPKRPSCRELRMGLAKAVWEAGFTFPEVVNASERDVQHYVLEFEGVGASPLTEAL